METTVLPSFLSISISISFLFFTYTASSVIICPSYSCDETGPVIQFPFRIKGFLPDRCGYPGYDLTCNNINQTILTLPYSGDLVVKEIDYDNQWIYINDPDSCLPRRILLDFNLTGSIFRPNYSENYTFFNCSASKWPDYIITGSGPVLCLGSANFTVIALDAGDMENASSSVPPFCRELSTVASPVQLTPVNPIPDATLRWKMPNCLGCEAAGGTCGYVGETGSEIGCFFFDTGSTGDSNRGLPRSAKYGIIIGVGIPGLVCLIALVCYCCGKVRTYGQRRRLDAQLSNLTSNPQPMVIITGLDGPTIESYPKTVIGESRRLPRPNDGTCPICLAEYQPKETLRTIPECNHYFHAKCVDEWLRMNATCPLCRNTPSESSVMTPSSSVSSSSSLSTSS
ncbi:putative RING-H2 finger protein ATL21A [Rhododendron vialii]|uniref:putative RING-H2 finger protein ATL21A n=1 Tax=Rhododendron vialii TaxID=182163 RepID=UPI00265FC57D|nr:putative RING-H2 finger protein ATL21A [Rhododendron vialii]